MPEDRFKGCLNISKKHFFKKIFLLSQQFYIPKKSLYDENVVLNRNISIF